MSTLTELRSEITAICATSWKTRDGEIIPEPEKVQLGNDAVLIDGTVLYADLVQSTALVNGYKSQFAAEIYKSFLVTACRIIRNDGGVITGFDGDRVMAVFIGGSRNSSAAKVALKINWAVKNVINPAIKAQYPDTSYSVSHVVGIDASPLFVARTGIRGSNDLVWVGRAANYAAKLCDIRDGSYSTYITADVFGRLSEEAKLGGNPKKLMWEKATWNETGLTIHRSSWWWALS
jgi:class 3 adenylate cyclase